jgi:hypothetical protein
MAQTILPENSPSLDKRFVALGQPAEELDSKQHSALKNKISYRRKSNLKSNWATLGWSDDSEFMPEGKISYSKVGNLDSKALALEEIKHIYKFNPRPKGKKFVTERYINFDDVDFGFKRKLFKIDDLPELRLTLFLQPDEGAIVFYQFSDIDIRHDVNADIQYVLPNSTGPDHHTNRDRLHYFFPIIPTGELSMSTEEKE